MCFVSSRHCSGSDAARPGRQVEMADGKVRKLQKMIFLTPCSQEVTLTHLKLSVNPCSKEKHTHTHTLSHTHTSARMALIRLSCRFKKI